MSIVAERIATPISQVEIPAWRGLSPKERISVRRVIQAVCSSGGVDRNTLVDQIAQLFCEKDLEEERSEASQLDFSYHHVRDLDDALIAGSKAKHLKDDLAHAETLATCIVAQFLNAEFLVMMGASIVVCAEYSVQPAQQV
jgi:hypothetical protein